MRFNDGQYLNAMGHLGPENSDEEEVEEESLADTDSLGMLGLLHEIKKILSEFSRE
jgi:hypothetical protein